jgi:hypothetical protein
VSRSATLILLVVTPLFLAYGRFSWSWLAGPVAALAVGALDLKAHEPSEPAPAREHAREPIPVD